ncbi:hypothetical protein, partial [Arcobacter sp.]|uniref:hypothetical protein n=1 Tax=Arcobacter sp. TaxID=1872629 RepID=UPI003D0DCA31
DNCKKVSFNKAKSFLYTVANNMMLNEIKHQKVVLKYQQDIKPNEFTNNESPEFILEKEQFLEKTLENIVKDNNIDFFGKQKKLDFNLFAKKSKDEKEESDENKEKKKLSLLKKSTKTKETKEEKSEK